MIMTNPNNTDGKNNDDIVTINASGKIFQVLRSTLCLPPKESAFVQLFAKNKNNYYYSKNNDSVGLSVQKHANGRSFFMDHDPELVEIILNFLRAKKIEDPFDPIVEAPFVPPHKSKSFRRLLNHFGLTAYFYYPSTTKLISPTMATIIPTTIHPIRSLSIGSQETETNHNLCKRDSSCSLNSSEDVSITEDFGYCYG